MPSGNLEPMLLVYDFVSTHQNSMGITLQAFPKHIYHHVHVYSTLLYKFRQDSLY